MNIQDAQERGIEDGDLVEVSTLRGSVPFRAVVTAEIVNGAIECNMGGGTPVGSKAWQQWNVNQLTDVNNYDEISGFPVYKALLCNVHKIKQDTLNKPRRIRSKAAVDEVNLIVSNAQKRKYGKRIYLDNNATTQVDDEVINVMNAFLKTAYGNPSSIHGQGKNALEAIENALNN